MKEKNHSRFSIQMFADTCKFSCMPNMKDGVSKESWPSKRNLKYGALNSRFPKETKMFILRLSWGDQKVTDIWDWSINPPPTLTSVIT